MGTTSWTEPIARPAADVWALVRDFGNDSWTSVAITIEGEGQGAVRTVHMPDGLVRERCERLDDIEQVLSYSILEGNPFPTSDYLGTMTVRSVDDASCELIWSSTWQTAEDPAPIAEGLQRFLRGSSRALRRHLEATGS